MQFENSRKYGINCAGFQSQKIEALPFAFDRPIRSLGVVDTGLIVCLEKKIDGQEQVLYDFYKIPL
jgi:hypothetical protein